MTDVAAAPVPPPATPAELPYRPGKPPKPDFYYGDSKAEYNDFIKACENAFLMDNNKRDQDRVTYGKVYVRGKIPANQWRQFERLHPDRSTITWADFKHQILLGLGDIGNQQILLEERYSRARQGNDEDARSYGGRLGQLEKELGRFPEERERFNKFRAGLKPSIKAKINEQAVQASTCQELVAQCHRIEDRYYTQPQTAANPNGPIYCGESHAGTMRTGLLGITIRSRKLHGKDPLGSTKHYSLRRSNSGALNENPLWAPLFRLTTGSTALVRKLVLDILQSRLQLHNISTPKPYTGHSFRKGAAQHTSDNGMLDQHIQKLGRWTSRAFQLYFETSVSSLYMLSMRFKTGGAISFHPHPNTLSTPLPNHNNSLTSVPFSSLGPVLRIFELAFVILRFGSKIWNCMRFMLELPNPLADGTD